MRSIRNLCIVLGDQLNFDSRLWHDFDPTRDMVWMAEVLSESKLPVSSKQRTAVFLSAMRHFAESLEEKDYRIQYHPLDAELESFEAALDETSNKIKFEAVRCVLPGDFSVYQSLNHYFKRHHISIKWLEDIHFITRPGEFNKWMKDRKQPRLEDWYRYLRKERNILMQNDNEPEGGAWNFDKQNRQSFGKDGPPEHKAPYRARPDKITEKVLEDINTYLADLPGQLEDFHWPVTRAEARRALKDFIEHRLPLFGRYQDAMWSDDRYLFHSLNPREVIDAAIKAYEEEQAPINAVEGFVRQILGWREYMRGLYWYYRDDWLSSNALKARRKLPDFYWDAQTNMNCLAQSINQVIEAGYGHHIQRLMISGLFALLYGVKPRDIHDWYLGMYIDAVAWVEIPNTIGMSQYADGGIVGSKPYIASGAYIQRMSNYCDDCRYQPQSAATDDACPFTTLFWEFIERHQGKLASNPRLAMQVRNWDKKSQKEKQAIKKRANWLHRHIKDI